MFFWQLALRLSLAAALGGTSWLLVRRLAVRTDAVDRAVLTGALSVALVTAVPVVMHYAGIAVNAANLALWHGILFLAVWLADRWPRPSGIPAPAAAGHDGAGGMTLLAPAALLLVAVLFPYTSLAGIDTYRWHGLAALVSSTGRIPWLIHPLGLLGFTPAAYPSAYPLLLATVNLLSGLDVDGAWYLCSLFVGGLALATAFRLGRRFFADDRWAAALAFFYVFSPLYMRYGHWATGRGLFLALMPLLLAAALDNAPRRAWPAAAAAAILLLLSHKTALVALPLFVAARLLACALPRRRQALAAAALAVMAPAALVLAGAFSLRPVWTVAVRLGWPAAAVVPALWLGAGGGNDRMWRRLVAAVILTLPLVLLRDMYGAMIALAPATLLGVQGLRALTEKYPYRRAAAVTAAVLLALAGSTAVVVQRSRAAMTPPLRAAAGFLNRHDPRGPFRIAAPGRAAARLRVYVHGYHPVVAYGALAGNVRRTELPPLRHPRGVKAAAHAWTTALRGLWSVEAPELVWADPALPTYYLRIDGKGHVPDGAVCIYDQDGVAIHAMPL